MNWGDITIGKYEKLTRIMNEDKGDDFTYNAIAVCFDKELDEVLGMNYVRVMQMAREIAPLSKSAPIPSRAKSEYKLNRKYKVVMNPNELTTAQYIDFQGVGNDYENNTPELLAILMIPDGHTYNTGYEMKDVVKDIRDNMKVEDALGLAAFFLHLLRKSIAVARRKMKWQLFRAKHSRKTTPEQREALEKVSQLLNGLRL